jgi:hypothetical protein
MYFLGKTFLVKKVYSQFLWQGSGSGQKSSGSASLLLTSNSEEAQNFQMLLFACLSATDRETAEFFLPTFRPKIYANLTPYGKRIISCESMGHNLP